MIIAIIVNTIENEAVTTGASGINAVATIDDGTLSAQLAYQELVPLLGTEIVPIEDIAILIVLEITFHCLQGSHLLSAATVAITHIHGDAHIRHQLGNGFARLGAAVGVIFIEHQVPAIMGLTVVNAKFS